MFSALVIALIASASGSHAAYGRRATGCPTGAPTNLNAGSLPNSTEAGQSGYNVSLVEICGVTWTDLVELRYYRFAKYNVSDRLDQRRR